MTLFRNIRYLALVTSAIIGIYAFFFSGYGELFRGISTDENQEYENASRALQLKASIALGDLKLNPEKFFHKKTGSDCHILRLSKDYLGQICFLATALRPLGENDNVVLAAQGPIRESDSWKYGGLESYFGDPFPHGARLIAEVRSDLIVRVHQGWNK